MGAQARRQGSYGDFSAGALNSRTGGKDINRDVRNPAGPPEKRARSLLQLRTELEKKRGGHSLRNEGEAPVMDRKSCGGHGPSTKRASRGGQKSVSFTAGQITDSRADLRKIIDKGKWGSQLYNRKSDARGWKEE